MLQRMQRVAQAVLSKHVGSLSPPACSSHVVLRPRVPMNSPTTAATSKLFSYAPHVARPSSVSSSALRSVPMPLPPPSWASFSTPQLGLVGSTLLSGVRSTTRTAATGGAYSAGFNSACHFIRHSCLTKGAGWASPMAQRGIFKCLELASVQGGLRAFHRGSARSLGWQPPGVRQLQWVAKRRPLGLQRLPALPHQILSRQWVRHRMEGALLGEDAALVKGRKLALPVGGLAGVFGSLVGVGGGVLIIPMIVNACKSIPQRVVSATSLIAVISTAAAASSTYFSAGLVDLNSAAVVAVAAVLTAPLGARLTMKLNCDVLRRILGWCLVGVAPLIPLKAYLLSRRDVGGGAAVAGSGESAADGNDAAGAPESGVASWKLTPLTGGMLAATGAVAGVASGLLGIGGGTIVTPLLALVTPLPQASVLGTSLLAMLPPSAVALAQHALLGNVDWKMGAALALGTMVGGAVGSRIALGAPDGALEGVFCVGMLYLGLKTLKAAKK